MFKRARNEKNSLIINANCSCICIIARQLAINSECEHSISLYDYSACVSNPYLYIHFWNNNLNAWKKIYTFAIRRYIFSRSFPLLRVWNATWKCKRLTPTLFEKSFGWINRFCFFNFPKRCMCVKPPEMDSFLIKIEKWRRFLYLYIFILYLVHRINLTNKNAWILKKPILNTFFPPPSVFLLHLKNGAVA